jgi:putative Holliday junction resolvase
VGRVMALDVGTKTIGVARSDATGIAVEPVTTIARTGVKADVERIAALIVAHDVERVVVGLPYELDGTEARSARLARQVGEATAARTGLPVVYVDERYTSVDAHRGLIAAGWSREQRKQVIDQAAAVLILKTWLDHRADVEE